MVRVKGGFSSGMREQPLAQNKEVWSGSRWVVQRKMEKEVAGLGRILSLAVGSSPPSD